MISWLFLISGFLLGGTYGILWLVAIALDKVAEIERSEASAAKVYPMCKPRLAQIDCRIRSCEYWSGGGICGNDAPAITLNPDPGKHVCWSYQEVVR